MNSESDQQKLHPMLRDGYEVLDEYNNADPATGDQKVIEQLSAFGADLSRDRHVVHYLYFLDDASRASVEEKLSASGYALRHGVDYPPADRPKCLIAERVGVVSDETLADERAIFTALSEEVNGKYDGWEAALD